MPPSSPPDVPASAITKDAEPDPCDSPASAKSNAAAAASFTPPSQLLQSLEVHFASHNKTCLKDCLGRRHKNTIHASSSANSISCPPMVMKLRRNNCTRTELHLSYVRLLTQYLQPLKDEANAIAAATAIMNPKNPSDPNQNKNKPLHTTLFHMERLATVTRFLQLLLEFQQPVEPDDADTSIVPEMRYETVCLQDEEIQKMVLQLIRSITGTVCSILEVKAEATQKNDKKNSKTESNESDDASEEEDASEEAQPMEDVYTSTHLRDSFDAITVACFALGELQTLHHLYVRTRPFLLAPLWKSLCEIGTAIATSHDSNPLPVALWKSGVRALTELLQDGLRAEEAPLSPFLTKILGFLLGRLTVFWKLQPSSSQASSSSSSCNDDDDEEDDSSATIAAAVQVLVRLRGVASSFSSSSPPPDPNNLLLAKVDKCWAAATAAQNHSDAPIQALLMRVPAQDTGHTVLWLVQYLEQQQQQQCANESNSSNAPWDEERVEWMLRMVEELVFQRLPRVVEPEHDDDETENETAASTLLLERSVQAVSGILWRAEVGTPCLATNLHPGRGRLHRWLVHWLAACPMHPLSRELALSLLHRHVVGLMGVKASTSSSSNNEAVPLLRLVVVLLLDARTATVLRGNLAALLSRLQADPRVRPRLERLVRAEYASWERALAALFRAEAKKKNKRKHRDRSGPPRHSTDDWWIIISILSQVSSLPVRRDGGSFCRQLASTSRLSTTQVQAAALHAALMDCNSSSSPPSEDRTGSYSSLLSDFFTAWNRHSNDRQRLILLAAAVLQQAQRMLRRHGNALPEPDFSSTVHLVCLCTTEASGTTETAQPEVHKLHNALLLEVIRVLGVVGKTVTAATPKAPLQSLARCFQSLLASNIWTVRAHTMTALVKFASAVPSVHQDVLKQCITSKPLEQWFRARLQGTVHCFGDIRPERLPALRKERHAFWLETTLPQRRRRSAKIFPKSSSFTVPSGSYLLTMSTQEGRNALVIFPPGEQSLMDIRTMLGGMEADEEDDDDDESNHNCDNKSNANNNNSNNPEIRTLQSVLALECGGCKMKTAED